MEPTDTSRDRHPIFDAPGVCLPSILFHLSSTQGWPFNYCVFSGRVYSIRQIKALFRSPSSEAENLEEQLQSELDLAWTSGS